jgi:GT2 family glycosyltransferase
MPEISVVVINWNGKHYLGPCLEALRRQSGVDFEVIVVDNGSEDGSQDFVEKEYTGREAFPVRLIRNERNLGFCAANNRGFAASRSPFVAILNNDTEVEPGWLSSLRESFRGRPEIGMAACKILVYENPKKIDKVGHVIYPDGQNCGRGTGEIDHGQYDRQEEILWPDGCAAMFRREMLDQIGGFDEDFFIFGDDAELGMRARIAGWRCLYVPQAVVRHHRGGAMKVASTGRLVLIERNRVLLAVKLFPLSLLWLNVPYYVLRILAGVWAALQSRGEISRYQGAGGKLRAGFALLKGDLAAIPLIPRMIRKRRVIRGISKLSPAQVRALVLENRVPLKTMMEQM